MAYEKKFRERVMKYRRKGNSIAKTADVFEVGTTTIKRWDKLEKETGSLEKRPLNRKFKKIDPEKLTAYIKSNPDAFLREIAEEFNCTTTAVFLAFEKLGITRKKNGRIRREE